MEMSVEASELKLPAVAITEQVQISEGSVLSAEMEGPENICPKSEVQE